MMEFFNFHRAEHFALHGIFVQIFKFEVLLSEAKSRRLFDIAVPKSRHRVIKVPHTSNCYRTMADGKI